jgi:hypothetical protein
MTAPDGRYWVGMTALAAYRAAQAESLPSSVMRAMIMAAAPEISALQARCAALEADALRYRWLRCQHEGNDKLDPIALAFTVFAPERGTLEPVGCMPGELDAAIDAAVSTTTDAPAEEAKP